MKKIVAFASAAVLGLGVAACDGPAEDAMEDARVTLGVACAGGELHLWRSRLGESRLLVCRYEQVGGVRQENE